MNIIRKLGKFLILAMPAGLLFSAMPSYAVVQDGALNGYVTASTRYCHRHGFRRVCHSYSANISVNTAITSNTITFKFGLPLSSAPSFATRIMVNAKPVVATVSGGGNTVTYTSTSPGGFSDLDFHDIMISAGTRFYSGSRSYVVYYTNSWRLRSLKCYLSPNNVDDTDRDGLQDCEEQPGVKTGSEPGDQSLDLYTWGARPDQMDIFVEVDYMDDETGRTDPYIKPRREALQKVVDSYAAHDIHVHFDTGDFLHQTAGLSPADFDLGGGNMIPFSEPTNFASTKESRITNMDATRQDYFYYMLFASSQLDNRPGSSGYGSNDLSKPENTTLITLGRWTSTNPTVITNFQAATMMHELGHNFGLTHGGPHSEESHNLKPNYLSIMNYMYQLFGIPLNGTELNQRYGRGGNVDYWPAGCNFGNVASIGNGPTDVNMIIDYSYGNTAPMDEESLNEGDGVDITDPIAMDFDCDGATDSINTAGFDVNHDGDLRVLNDHNDWNTNNWLMYFYMQNNPVMAPAGASFPVPAEEFTPPDSFFDELSNL